MQCVTKFSHKYPVSKRENNRRAVGHKPLELFKILSSFLKRVNHGGEAVVCVKRVIERGAGVGLEILVVFFLKLLHR